MPTSPSTRTIVAVNPSHATRAESMFWSEFAGSCVRSGWRLVQVAARTIPSIDNADTIVVPARLRDFHRWADTDSPPVPWLSDDDIAMHVEWEHRRWELLLYDPVIWAAARELAAFVDRVVTTFRPAVVVTTNKVDHPCAFARRAALHHGVPLVGLIERSPFESIWFERDGLFSESEIWTEASPWRSVNGATDTGHRIVDRLLANPAGFRTNQAPTAVADLSRYRRPLVFLPFDNVLWTGWLPADHPQGRIDYPILDEPAAALEEIASWVDDVGGTLVVKAHPSCRETSKLFRPPAVALVDAPLAQLLQASDATVAFNTKVAFVSLAANVPTVTLADNPAAAGGHTFHWKSFEHPADALVAALDAPRSAPDVGVATFFGQLEVGHFYGPSGGGDWVGGADRLFSDLVARIDPGAIDEKGVAPTCDTTDGFRPGPSGPRPRTCAARPARPRVVLAADRVVQPNAQSSGIARYGWELLNGLEAHDRWELFVLLQEPDVGWHRGAATMFDRVRRVVGDRMITVAKSQPQDSILRRLGEFGPSDVVHSIHLPLPPIRVTGRAARFLTIHDVLHVSQPHLNATAGVPTIDRVLKSIDWDRDRVICDSDQTRRDLLAITPMPGTRVETIALGVSSPRDDEATSRASLVPPSWTGYLVTMLQPEPRKNCSALLEAAADAFRAERFPGIGLVAVGTVSAIRRYRADLDRIDPSRLVTHADIADGDLQQLLRRADGFVYPSLYEGFGLPPLEAMACGCPVVVVASSSLIEVTGDAALYTHSGTATDLGVAIELLLSSPSLRAELSRRGRQRAAELSWHQTIQRTVAFYERAISRTKAVRSGNPIGTTQGSPSRSASSGINHCT